MSDVRHASVEWDGNVLSGWLTIDGVPTKVTADRDAIHQNAAGSDELAAGLNISLKYGSSLQNRRGARPNLRFDSPGAAANRVLEVVQILQRQLEAGRSVHLTSAPTASMTHDCCSDAECTDASSGQTKPGK
jgi:hypothetical protein